jgi:hypothetical protein
VELSQLCYIAGVDKQTENVLGIVSDTVVNSGGARIYREDPL